MQTLEKKKNGQSSLNFAESVPLTSQAILVDITPEIAQAWLGMAGEGHRTISGPKVNKITRDISGDEYLVTAAGVGFDLNGRLIDGRHRLSAVVDSGLPIKSWVIFGLDPKAIDVTDDGRPRSHGDIFKMAKEHHYSMLAALVSHVWRYERKLWGKSTMTPTKPESKKWLADHPRCRESLSVGGRGHVIIAPSVLAAGHYIFSQIDKADAERFCEQVISGVGLGANDPAKKLRDVMLADRAAKRKMSTIDRFALTIKAWNAFRRRETIYQLKWARKGRGREAFPVAI